MDCSNEMKPFKMPRLCGHHEEQYSKALLAGPGAVLHFDEIKHKLPSNYVHKPNTIILIDKHNNPVLKDNGDGTVSGIPIDKFLAA